MKKILMMVLAALLCCTMAMAQTTPAISWKYSGHFPILPPLKVDFNMSLFHHSQPNLMLISLDGKKDKDTNSQSIIIRHKEKKVVPHYHYESRPDHSPMADNLAFIHEWIVSEIRKREGRHSRPLPPHIMRKKMRN